MGSTGGGRRHEAAKRHWDFLGRGRSPFSPYPAMWLARFGLLRSVLIRIRGFVESLELVILDLSSK